MKILYVFPHPDDESFGPAAVMNLQRRKGHQVYLLTLTKGGATKQREKLNYSIEKMGEVRFNEMLKVAEVLKLSGITVLDLPDSGLKEIDPRIIEKAVREEILRIEPFVVVTYPVHGISGFHDHLITHSIVKRVYEELKEKQWFLRRLAFTTLDEQTSNKSKHFKLNYSTDSEIDCEIEVEESDINAANKSLDCYKTYKETIDNSGVRKLIGNKYFFEIYREEFNPPLTDLFDKLKAD